MTQVVYGQKGYLGSSMSVRAAEAYEQGEMPISRWTKTAIIQAVKDYCFDFDLAYDSSGKETARTTLVSATGKTSIKLTPETTNLCANGQDLCFLNIDLIGENGITKSSVDQELKIEISGPATLQGYGSARPNVEESFCNDTFKTFYGKSLAVIRAGYEPGTVTVKVSGKGLDTQELTLNIC